MQKTQKATTDTGGGKNIRTKMLPQNYERLDPLVLKGHGKQGKGNSQHNSCTRLGKLWGADTSSKRGETSVAVSVRRVTTNAPVLRSLGLEMCAMRSTSANRTRKDREILDEATCEIQKNSKSLAYSLKPIIVHERFDSDGIQKEAHDFLPERTTTTS